MPGDRLGRGCLLREKGTMKNTVSEAAALLGRLGGLKTSPRKTRSGRLNVKKATAARIANARARRERREKEYANR